VFRDHADVMGFLAGEAPPGLTRVMAVDAEAWVLMVMPIVPPPEAAGDA